MSLVEVPADALLFLQALPSFQIPVSPHIYTSISWAAAPTTTSSLSPVSVYPQIPKLLHLQVSGGGGLCHWYTPHG